MHDSLDSSSQVITQLNRWVKTNVRAPYGEASLKKPSEFVEMSDSDRKQAQLEDRTKVASEVMNVHGANTELLAILAALSNPSAPNSRATYCSAVREVFRGIQENAWTEFALSKAARRRKPVTV